MRSRKYFPTSVLVLILNGGFNQIAYRFLFYLLLLTFLFAAWYFKVWHSRCFFRAFWYISFGSLDMVLLDENTEIRFSVDVGVCSRMLGAWFDSLWVYSMIKSVVRLKIRIIQVECKVQVIDQVIFILHWVTISNLFSWIFFFFFVYFVFFFCVQFTSIFYHS